MEELLEKINKDIKEKRVYEDTIKVSIKADNKIHLGGDIDATIVVDHSYQGTITVENHPEIPIEYDSEPRKLQLKPIGMVSYEWKGIFLNSHEIFIRPF